MRVTGVDGCRGGWLAATVDDGAVTWTWTREVATVLRDPSVDVVAIDIPIGLPANGTRSCDVDARRLLGPRRSSVFPAPVRAVLRCSTYAEARALLAARGGRSMSAQAFGIVAAVRCVDAAVSPADETRVFEAHPELAFVRMNGGVPLAGKRATAGIATRLRLLAGWRSDVLDVLAEVPAEAVIDDALDALACAAVAQRAVRRDHVTLGAGERDDRGLVMRIVY